MSNFITQISVLFNQIFSTKSHKVKYQEIARLSSPPRVWERKKKITNIVCSAESPVYDRILVDMKYKAVIFDLFGTLVPSISLEEHENAMRQMAAVLSIPSEELSVLWIDTSYQREIGEFPNKEANFEYICNKLKVPVDSIQIKAATQISTAITKQLMKPRVGAIEVVTRIKSEGYKTGLITNCTSDVPNIWENTLLAPLIDAPLFSCVVGIAKPDPNIYRLIVEELQVEPRSCLYLGDGSGNELEGALHVGMQPVLIRVPDKESNNPYRIASEDWDGPTISSLKEVFELLG